MAKTLAVTLDDNQQRFFDEQVAEARFASADEVVSEGLRLLAEREAENARIRALLIEGEESGIVETSVTEIFEAAMARFEARNG